MKSRGKEAKNNKDNIGFLKITLEDPPYTTENDDLKC